ncbi:hypothetical protein CYMTET_31652 [Cymbomonas tetramitiformis]|uniref:HAT C-terminal dimerisation domain-containing protein n=1 Tax=Cymbomonas tetramitiformis TaxID=36881 RepID=A0AAE0FGM5_9CHLO|nr:hypothetical protein CYMTET_31652 [Cymbomonas tetramitiformis]
MAPPYATKWRTGGVEEGRGGGGASAEWSERSLATSEMSEMSLVRVCLGHLHLNFEIIGQWDLGNVIRSLLVLVLGCVYVGTFTKEQAWSLARAAWEQDWKPAEKEVDEPPAKRARIVNTAQFNLLNDERDEEEPPALVAPCSFGDDEFARYLALPDAPRSIKVSPWWVEHKDMFPNVFRVYRQFLAPPASSAGVEKLFSGVDRMHGDLQKCTSECTLKHIMMASAKTK